MSRYPHGSPRHPLLIRYDRYSEPNSLSEAKLAAWSLATGARLPKETNGRRLHRAALPDVLPPNEPPQRATRPGLALRLRNVLRILFGGGTGPATPIGAPAVAVVESANVTYIGRAVETVPGAPDGEEQSAKPCAA